MKQVGLEGRVDLDYLTYHPEKPEGVDLEDQVDLKYLTLKTGLTWKAGLT